MMNSLTYMAISPVLVLQALYTRTTALKLPEPPGARQGSSGQGPALNLLITGDSAAAGVGAAKQKEALSGQLVDRLARQFQVNWRLEAESGATTADTLERLSNMKPGKYDVAVTSLGVNDVTGHVGLQQWLKQQGELRRLLKKRFGVSFSLISGLPPVHGFPALPHPLRRYLGDRATQFDEALKSELLGDPESKYLDLRFSDNPDFIAEDGFHPGPEMYAAWGERAKQAIFRAILS